MRNDNHQCESLDGIRQQFPILKKNIAGKRYIYLDSAATALKPDCVIEAVSDYYRNHYANVHRGAYYLSRMASQQYEQAREKIKTFFNADDRYEVIFTSGATEAVNLVVNSFCRPLIQQDDTILVSQLEHHSNFLPWKILASQTNANFKVLPLDDSGGFSKPHLQQALCEGVRFAALTHASNVTGISQPLDSIISDIHSSGGAVLIDAAQSASHLKIDLASMDPDFIVCSAHKMLGPTGIGAVILKKHFLQNGIPFKTGGGTVLTINPLSWKEGVRKFEAGTPNFVGVNGWASAINFLEQVGLDNIHKHVSKLVAKLLDGFKQINRIRIFASNNPHQNAGIVSFLVDGIHPHDVAAWLDSNAIAVRDGHHCAQPLMEHLGVQTVVRASLHLYNTIDDIDALLGSLNSLVDNERAVFSQLYGKQIPQIAALTHDSIPVPDSDFQITGRPDYCGDLITYRLKINDSKLIVETESDLCIPSCASLNVLLKSIQDKPLDDIHSLCESALLAFTSDVPHCDIRDLAPLLELKQIRPSCIALPWKTMLTAAEKLIKQRRQPALLL